VTDLVANGSVSEQENENNKPRISAENIILWKTITFTFVSVLSGQKFIISICNFKGDV
jgi:hypothetical protein